MKFNISRIKKTKMFWAYIVVGALFVVASIFLAPIWDFWKECPWKDWGRDIVKIILAAGICIYLFGYLLKRIIRRRGTIQILSIVEFVLLLLIALGCVLSQCNILKIEEACIILGLVLWCEGAIDLFRAYFHQKDSKSPYPIWRLCIAIALVSVGMWMICKPLFQNIAVLWTFVALLFLLGVLAIVIGALAKPAGKAKKAKLAKTKAEKKSDSADSKTSNN